MEIIVNDYGFNFLLMDLTWTRFLTFFIYLLKYLIFLIIKDKNLVVVLRFYFVKKLKFLFI